MLESGDRFKRGDHGEVIGVTKGRNDQSNGHNGSITESGQNGELSISEAAHQVRLLLIHLGFVPIFHKEFRVGFTRFDCFLPEFLSEYVDQRVYNHLNWWIKYCPSEKSSRRFKTPPSDVKKHLPIVLTSHRSESQIIAELLSQLAVVCGFGGQLFKFLSPTQTISSALCSWAEDITPNGWNYVEKHSQMLELQDQQHLKRLARQVAKN